ncbi:alpha/beta hydrolase [Nocardioides campestrisoli]|uniref:alpha/beta hydrolase n=1 Tax=Nocardioides campestrisoli TaxID=2736757 RepID=UPI00163D8D08|nr:alpha/beta fold hydrolase [Nocardioides campestrisoli]
MSIDPRARPLSLPARPEATGGRRVGVLLSHGFTGSPASIRPWGEALAQHGYAVEVPRLPGHGTSWRDLDATGWDDWYGEIERTFLRLSRTCDAVVVGGLSMGGTLALRLAAEHGDAVAGLVLVNPAVHSTRKDLLALPLLKHLVGSVPGLADDIRKPGVTEHGYVRTPLGALHSLTRQWRALRADLPRVTSPLLLLRSAEDHVVDPSSARIIAREVSSRELTERVLPDSYHVATLDHDAETICAESAAFVSRVTAEGLPQGSRASLET